MKNKNRYEKSFYKSIEYILKEIQTFKDLYDDYTKLKDLNWYEKLPVLGQIVINPVKLFFKSPINFFNLIKTGINFYLNKINIDDVIKNEKTYEVLKANEANLYHAIDLFEPVTKKGFYVDAKLIKSLITSLINNPEIIKQYSGKTTTSNDYIIIGSKLLRSENFQNYLRNNSKNFLQIVNEVIKQQHLNLPDKEKHNSYLSLVRSYGIDDLQKLSTICEFPELIASILEKYSSINKNSVSDILLFGAEFIKQLNNNKQLKDTLTSILPNVIRSPEVIKTLQPYGIDATIGNDAVKALFELTTKDGFLGKISDIYILTTQNTMDIEAVFTKAAEILKETADPAVKAALTSILPNIIRSPEIMKALQPYGIKNLYERFTKALSRFIFKFESLDEVKDLVVKMLDESLDIFAKNKLIAEAVMNLLRNVEFKEFISDHKDTVTTLLDDLINLNPQYKTKYNINIIRNVISNLSQLQLKNIDNPSALVNILQGIEVAHTVLIPVVNDQKMIEGIKKEAYSIISEFIYKKDKSKAEVIEHVLTKEREMDSLVKIDLLKALKSFLKEKLTEKDLAEIVEKNVMDLSNSIFTDTNFANCKLSALNFTSSIFQKCDFSKSTLINTNYNGSIFKEGVNFSDSIISSKTLKSLIPALKESANLISNRLLVSDILFTNTKFTGNLDGIDFSGLSLKGADFTKVRSMIGVDLNNCDLSDAKISKERLLECKNLRSIRSINTDLEKIIDEQNKKILTRIDGVFRNANIEDVEGFKEDLLKNASLMEKIVRKYENSEDNLADLIFESARVIEEIHTHNAHNEKEVDKLEDKLIIDEFSKKLAYKLFNEGKAREKDKSLINNHLQKVFEKLKERYPEFECQSLLDPLYEKKILGKLVYTNAFGALDSAKSTGLAKVYYDISSYTGFGLFSGGITIREHIISNPEFVDEVIMYIEKTVPRILLSNSDKEIVENLATIINREMDPQVTKDFCVDQLSKAFVKLEQYNKSIEQKHEVEKLEPINRSEEKIEEIAALFRGAEKPSLENVDEVVGLLEKCFTKKIENQRQRPSNLGQAKS